MQNHLQEKVILFSKNLYSDWNKNSMIKWSLNKSGYWTTQLSDRVTLSKKNPLER